VAVNDLGLVFLGMALGGIVFVILGVLGDSWDARERRDAQRRNRGR
jgi:hypothetical protein